MTIAHLAQTQNNEIGFGPGELKMTIFQ